MTNDQDETRVDLGEDLLEKTRTLPNVAKVPDVKGALVASAVTSDLQDQFESARILLNENLTEEAKRILRKILLIDPKHVGAREKLDEIHELELQQLFREDRPRRSFEVAELGEIDTEKLILELDRELQLGIAAHPRGERGLSLLLERDLVGASPQDRIDLGISFLEMGLFEHAVHQFEIAQKSAQSTEIQVQALGLSAQALVESAKYYDAIFKLQTLVRDSEISESLKLDLFYWMGRAHQGLQKKSEALQWFLKVQQLDPYYRDVQERIRAQGSA